MNLTVSFLMILKLEARLFFRRCRRTASKTIADVIVKMDELWKRKLDAILLYFMILIIGLACYFMAKRVKNSHVFMREVRKLVLLDQRVPEELNRSVLDHLRCILRYSADCNMSRRCLSIAEGIRVQKPSLKLVHSMDEVH